MGIIMDGITVLTSFKAPSPALRDPQSDQSSQAYPHIRIEDFSTKSDGNEKGEITFSLGEPLRKLLFSFQTVKQAVNNRFRE